MNKKITTKVIRVHSNLDTRINVSNKIVFVNKKSLVKKISMKKKSYLDYYNSQPSLNLVNIKRNNKLLI